MSVVPDELLVRMFDLPAVEAASEPLRPQKLLALTADELAKFSPKAKERYLQQCAMYQAGTLESKLPCDEMLRCLLAYQDMRVLRNETNHAMEKRPYKTIPQIKEQIEYLLRLLERAKD